MAAMMWDGKERLARANGRDAADEREKSEGREAEEERGKRPSTGLDGRLVKLIEKERMNDGW